MARHLTHKPDANQSEIIDGLRSLGATVVSLSNVGGGCPDIVIGYKGVNYLVEIKDGNKPKSERELRAKQHAFFDSWKGQVEVATSLDECLKIIGWTG